MSLNDKHIYIQDENGYKTWFYKTYICSTGGNSESVLVRPQS
jgi:hypothetical protein